jgi:hypothetical protein
MFAATRLGRVFAGAGFVALAVWVKPVLVPWLALALGLGWWARGRGGS